ncbi:MAG: amino acid ABC transporter permease, partial [Gammaproteobacteria bacterium]|nr:amino acid ABC transporter permease [Gammaproteobacteria bacterium]NIM72396.1 amino acid ABC transporter permease [Gammaproteobacteria bacterium]NIN37263.1 amino acid ABC transporter permease [Gammaproteobacteria bacterium]NIO24153.1 amino acid ABC transporter permease [Gammaproteobacteria bacterium]NIO64760.1 amino acid ABC transporter permease [Gammaproteobacteria bacterium]
MDPFYEWFRQLYDTTGWNLVFMYEEYERDRLLAAMWITIKLSA